MARAVHTIRHPAEVLGAARPQRRFGVRLWLGLAFAAVGLITAASVYLLVSDTSGEAARERSEEIATGRTVRLADRVVGAPTPAAARDLIADATTENYAAWLFDSQGKLASPGTVRGVDLSTVEGSEQAVNVALRGGRFFDSAAGDVSIVSAPVIRDGAPDGAILAHAARPAEVREALEALRGDRLRALAIAVGVAVLIGFMISTLITTRVKRLAAGASQIAEGGLNEPLIATGRDEIGDLGRALDAMRVALRESFTALSSERDRLSAIFEGMTEAVMVVGEDGVVRFANPAAEPLVLSDRRPVPALEPWLRRATERGTASHDALRIEERVYGFQARELPAEGAVLAVVRDRTEALRRELAERDFISNAAHELRNPIAGISGAVEVLRAGAKDDPEAREHFLNRLSEEAERVSRLTQSLLTLARMEAIGEGEAEIVDVAAAADEAARAVDAPDGIALQIEVDHASVARGDPVLLRQVLIGLLTNAFKNTPVGGAVTLRARREGDSNVMIEVTDTGEGIPPEELDRVFERFYRGSGQLERQGFGLGLAIAKRMVDVMGGEIGVSSDPGKGSMFWVRLALATAPTPVA